MEPASFPRAAPLSGDPQRILHGALYLTGPTAVGKTAVGLALARRLGAEIIALDAFTLYRGMDIGTAKPTPAERAEVPHHLIDVLDPWETVSVADYRSWAIAAARGIVARGRPVLFVGGSGMYLKALLRGLFEGPPAAPRLREELELQSGPALHARLARVDPAAAARLHPNDRRRVIRALEVFELTGRPLSEQQAEHDRPAEGVSVVALSRPREELHHRIDRRVVQMFTEGLIDEVRRLLAAPRPPGTTAFQGVGYREVIEHLGGEYPLEATIARIQARTRQFAKRQETWFRGLAEVRPFPVQADEPPEQTAAAILNGLPASRSFW